MEHEIVETIPRVGYSEGDFLIADRHIHACNAHFRVGIVDVDTVCGFGDCAAIRTVDIHVGHEVQHLYAEGLLHIVALLIVT